MPKSWISSTGGNAKILTGLLEKKPIAAYGVEWGPFEESKTVVEVKGVKVLALFKSKEFGAMAVYPNEDPDLPQITGMPNKICSVWSGIVKVYAKGVDVPLNTNLLRRWDNFGPMDCANIQKPSIFKD